MTQLKALLFSLCLSCVCMPTTTFAQIQEGNYNFGGDVGLSLNSFSSKTLNGKDVSLFLSPSIGKFLTNELLVSVQPILSTQNQTLKFSDLVGNSRDYTFGQTNAGVGIGSRYYLNLTDKISFFGAVNAGWSHQWNSTSQVGQFGNFDNKTEGNTVTYGGGVGLNVGVKQGVFFEASLSYNAMEIQQANFGIRKNDFFTLSCGLNHFIGNPKKADIDADYAFIKKGRQMFGGGLTINKIRDIYSTTINPKFSQFFTDNILVSGEALINNVSGAGIDNQVINLTVSSRYYFPVKNRFFLYPELSYTRRYQSTSFNTGSDYSKNELAIGIGGNYFLSKNVALEATFLQARFNVLPENEQQRSFTGLVGLGNIGVVYFIR